MRYAYYPGCSLGASAEDYDRSVRAVFDRLDLELVDLENWNCCGATPAESVDPLLGYVLPARNLALAENKGLEVMVTPCSGCYKNMLKTAKAVKNDQALRDEINEVLGDKEVKGKIEVKHPLEVMVRDYGLEALQERVTRPLAGLVVAPYYGCVIPRLRTGFDHPENPTSMEGLIAALGAEPISYFPYKTRCCGGGVLLPNEEVALGLTKRLLLAAQEMGANCVMVTCPLCDMLLDAYQPKIRSHFNLSLDMPIFYFTQLIGLALGMKETELGLEKRIVTPYKLLDKLPKAA